MTGFSNVGKASGFAGIGSDGSPEGDLTGSYPNPLVVGIWDNPVDPRVPANGDTLVYNGGEWIPTPAPTATTYFQGIWDANANSPDIANFPGLSDGFVWIVSVAGNTDVGGITGWIVGDYAVYSNGNWYKLSNSSFGWGLTGNNGTSPAVNYIGTADAHDMVIRANASERIRAYWTGGTRIEGNLLVSNDLQVTNNVTGSNAKLTGDLAVCGGDITTNSAVFNLLNGATTRINMGNSAACNWISGSTKFPQGISGSLTRLVDGTSAFIADVGIIVTSASNGAVTFKVDDSKFASLTGSVFTGPVSFNAGLSGSLTKLVDGTSYIIAGANTTVTSASNGAITITAIPNGSDTHVQFNDGGFFRGDSGLTYNKTTDSLTIAGDLAVNGGDLTTTSTTFNLVNTAATTVNLAGGASVGVNAGNSSGTNTISGTTKFPQGISGSLTKLTDGTSAFVGDVGVIVTSASNGAVTFKVDDSKFASLTGSVFTGPVSFNAGLSGSLTRLTDGTSYIVAGTNTTVTSASNGAITITAIPDGVDTQVQFNDGGFFRGDSGLTYNKTTDSLTIAGDLAVNGGDLTTTSTTFNFVNTTATTVNMAGGATIGVNIGNVLGTNTVSGTSKFPQGVSGSLTKLTDGTSYLTAGQNITITSASNGSVNIAFSTPSAPAATDFLAFDGTSWAPSSATAALQNSYQTVRASGNILAGDVCYVVNAGGSNPFPTVSKAQANSLATVKGVLGLATTDIANGTNGIIQTYGQLIGPVNTQPFSQGAPLFVSTTTAGAVTDVKPSGPNYAFQIGFVTRQGQPQNVTTGIVFVSPMMQTDTQNISDLSFTSPAEHEVVTYEAATSLWKNKQPLWVPNTQTAVTLAAGATITAANFSNVVYLPINTQGGANITLNASTPIASLTKTAADYGRELWLHNLDNNRNVTIPAGGNVKLDGGVNLVMTPNTIAKFVWTGIGGNGAWVQTSKALVAS